MAPEARQLVYGEADCPGWGTLFAEILDDAKDVGHQLIRLLMQQSAEGQAETLPSKALTIDSGELAQAVGSEQRTLETESGKLSWRGVSLPDARSYASRLACAHRSLFDGCTSKCMARLEKG